MKSKDGKACSWCGSFKNMKDFYSKMKTKASGEEYIYYHPECKECTKQNSTKWYKENPERYKVFYTKRNQREEYKQVMKEASKKQRESGYHKEYYYNNQDKFVEYRANRVANKEHDITDQEWLMCLDYFDKACAYCGIKEDKHLILYGQVLHKEHVVHDGSNYIENNVPACKSCNSQKSDLEFNEWYNNKNPNYTDERVGRIVSWVTRDFIIAFK